MRLIKPYYKILTPINREEMLKHLEMAGRTCYQSESTDTSASDFIKKIIKSGHESVIEHVSLSVRFICDRGISHELVRHRLASFSQESTRYVCSVDKNKVEIKNEEDIVEAYSRGWTMKRISTLSNGIFTEWDVYKTLDKHEIKKRGHNRKGILNDDFFEKIDFPEKAYLLGILQSDGNIGDSDYQITISQNHDNIWYLEKMVQNFIWTEAKAWQEKNRPNAGGVAFTSKKIHEDLLAKGVVPRKSKGNTKEQMDRLWESIPIELIPQFLRGFLDGDGCVRFFKQNNPGQTDSCHIEWTGNEYLLTHIQEWLKINHNYDARVRKDSDSEKLFRISITQPEVGESVCRKMYKDFVFPYGNPNKASRIYDRISFPYSIAEWGEPRFKIILPVWFTIEPAIWRWMQSMDMSEKYYDYFIELGWKPQEARSVLPNALKTEIVITANLREWRLIFKQRTSPLAHPQMRELMVPLLEEMKGKLPEIFGDI